MARKAPLLLLILFGCSSGSKERQAAMALSALVGSVMDSAEAARLGAYYLTRTGREDSSFTDRLLHLSGRIEALSDSFNLGSALRNGAKTEACSLLAAGLREEAEGPAPTLRGKDPQAAFAAKVLLLWAFYDTKPPDTALTRASESLGLPGVTPQEMEALAGEFHSARKGKSGLLQAMASCTTLSHFAPETYEESDPPDGVVVLFYRSGGKAYGRPAAAIANGKPALFGARALDPEGTFTLYSKAQKVATAAMEAVGVDGGARGARLLEGNVGKGTYIGLPGGFRQPNWGEPPQFSEQQAADAALRVLAEREYPVSVLNVNGVTVEGLEVINVFPGRALAVAAMDFPISGTEAGGPPASYGGLFFLELMGDEWRDAGFMGKLRAEYVADVALFERVSTSFPDKGGCEPWDCYGWEVVGFFDSDGDGVYEVLLRNDTYEGAYYEVAKRMAKGWVSVKTAFRGE